MPTLEQIAAAVQGHIKALRLLGRENTSVGQVAEALKLDISQIQSAMENFRISGARINPRLSRFVTITKTAQTPVIDLSKLKRKI